MIKETLPGKLVLHRAQNSGELTVTATVDNGGEPTVQTATVVVTEPDRDAWIARTPGRDEMPEDNQFYARDDENEGTLVCNGTLEEAADSVFLRVYADDRPYRSESCKLPGDKAYAFSVKLKPGLVRYRVEFGSRTGDRETVRHTAGNLVCGDAYLINGQSNAVATDWGEGEPAFHSPWIRSFGSMSGNPNPVRLWGDAVYRDRDGQKLQIGYWGMELARRLVEDQQIPVCILNGAVGGTRIDQHQRNPEDPADTTTIYGRLLWRVQQAKLTHGVRGVLWHQGENDQGADGPTGGFGWETYRQTNEHVAVVEGLTRSTLDAWAKRSTGEQEISRCGLRLYSISTHAWVASLRNSSGSSATPSSISTRRPSSDAQKHSCLPFW